MNQRQRLTYSVEDAAYLLGVHELTLRAAIERGEIPAARVGRRILVSRSTLVRMLDPDGQAEAQIDTSSAGDGR